MPLVLISDETLLGEIMKINNKESLKILTFQGPIGRSFYANIWIFASVKKVRGSL